MLKEDGAGLAFSHELAREALYEDMPRAVRRTRHREAARLLAAAGVRSDRVAEHWVAGADPGDMQAVAWLRQAAEETAGRSPAVAVDLFQRASDLCPPGEPARAEILAQMISRSPGQAAGTSSRTYAAAPCAAKGGRGMR